jgi:hypothetical protein
MKLLIAELTIICPKTGKRINPNSCWVRGDERCNYHDADYGDKEVKGVYCNHPNAEAQSQE